MAWKLEDLADSEFACECGRVHKVPIKRIRMGEGALDYIAKDMAELGLTGTPLIVADETTYDIAGSKVEQIIQEIGVSPRKVILRPHHNLKPSSWVLPNEQSLGEVLLRLPDKGPLIAVGSGTINDITRFIASKTNRSFLSVATAASMDGYASTVAPLLTGSFKRTSPAGSPIAIYAEPNILATAPLEMAGAGFGDLLGKSIALADWRLSHIINDEYYCPTIAAVVEDVLAAALADVNALAVGNPDALLRLTEGLVLSGVAILMFGDSRPVSGAEHELAHFWEIKGLAHGRLFYHGDKVAIGTLFMTRLYENVLALEPASIDWARVYAQRPSLDTYQQVVQQDFGKAWDEVHSPSWETTKQAELKRPTGELLYGKWDRIQHIVPKSLLTAEEIVAHLAKLGIPKTPAKLGIQKEWLMASIRSGKEMKPHRYTILDLADEMGCLDAVIEQYC